eukprot:5408695-Pyramimonas_sp.AAC.1
MAGEFYRAQAVRVRGAEFCPRVVCAQRRTPSGLQGTELPGVRSIWSIMPSADTLPRRGRLIGPGAGHRQPRASHRGLRYNAKADAPNPDAPVVSDTSFTQCA